MGTLWYGGRIYTMEDERTTCEAVYVEDGLIQKTGTIQDIRATYQGKITEEINIGNAIMYPGFIDSHLHMIGHGEKLSRLDLSTTTTSEELAEKVKSYASQAEPGEWVIGDGWNENLLEDKKIFDRKELDELSPNNPLVLTRICRHAALVNTKALEIAGVSTNTPDPPGGVIVRNDHGELTGYLLDQAQDLIKNCIPIVSEHYIRQALTLSLHDLVSKGLVGGHTEDLHYYGGFKRTFDQFLNVIGLDEGQTPFRANLLVHHEAVEEMLACKYHVGDISPFISLGAMKIFADGALGGRTALLKKPYHDNSHTNGVAIHTKQELDELVKKARDHKMPVAIHAIGDQALENALDAIEMHPPVSPKQRDRIIHAQVVNEELIRRLQKLSIILDIQPCFVASDFPWVIDRLGQERIEYAYAWKTLLHSNIICAGGSDAPIEEPDPLLGIHAAITRRTPTEEHSGFSPKEKLTAYEAVKLYTVGSAQAITREEKQGQIAEGYFADFTLLDKDLFQIKPDDILKTNVRMTVIHNKIVFSNDGGGDYFE